MPNLHQLMANRSLGRGPLVHIETQQAVPVNLPKAASLESISAAASMLTISLE